MKVKNRLSLLFTFMFAVLLLLVLTGIYLFVNKGRIRTFYDKLDDRAFTVGQFYLAEDNLSKKDFSNVVKRFPQSLSHEYIRIYDEHYRPQFIPENSVHWNINIIKAVIDQKKVHLSQGDRQITGIYYVDNSGNFIILVSAIDDSGLREMHELGLIMFFFFLASLIITFFIGRVFSRVTLAPIVRITNNLKIIRSTSLNLRLQVKKKKIDEIDTLSFTINQLLEHLEQSFESQKSFIANASHELRTPITTMLGEAEIALMHDRDNEEYKLVLNNIIKETERLNNIINSLMDLIQTNTSNYDFQNIRMDELLWELVDELPPDAVKINYPEQANKDKFTLQGNRQLLFIGINNIIKNAIKFSDNKQVYCNLFFDGKEINILIRDQGIGIHSQDIDKIFQPFFRSPNALNYPGYGIGLSLTQNIVRLHNGTIKVESQINKGTEFHLIFPII
jgi:signal transduction histidine kinase